MSLNRWLCTLLVGLLPMVTVRAAITEQDVVALPVKGLNAVKQDGSVVFMSENGRFVIKGELYDLWYKKRITDFVEMRTLATHLDLAKMKLDVSALNSVSMGKGRQKSVVVFVSHRCPHCRALIQQAQPLTADYRFQWILIAHAEPSDPAAIQDIVCAKLPLEALLTVVNNPAAVVPPTKACGVQKAALTQLTMQLMGIDRVPFLIAPDGRFHSGIPKNLTDWLAGKS